MRSYIAAIVVALSLVLVAAPAAAQTASVDAHGQCTDGQGNGGGGGVGADTDGNVDATDPDEAQSIVAGLLLFFEGTLAGQDDACPGSDDDNGDGTETSSEEDHLTVGVTVAGETAGACYDNDGDQLHTTPECHDAPH